MLNDLLDFHDYKDYNINIARNRMFYWKGLVTMTKDELRHSKEYQDMMNRIQSYPQGFTFTLRYVDIPKAKGNALRIITHDAIKQGLLESISIGLSIAGEFEEESYKRL